MAGISEFNKSMAPIVGFILAVIIMGAIEAFNNWRSRG